MGNDDWQKLSIRLRGAEHAALVEAADQASVSAVTLLRFALSRVWGDKPDAGRMVRAYAEELAANVGKVGR